MQPNSGQNPNTSSNHQSNQNLLHFHHHCSHHPPFPHIHIPVFFCSHPDHHHQYHFHHPQLHATQLPCNSSLPFSSSPLPPLPFSQAFVNQASQGPEINHATVSESELTFPPQELATSNILEDNEEEEEDIFVLTDEWAEFFAKSEAKRQLAKKNKKKNRT